MNDTVDDLTARLTDRLERLMPPGPRLDHLVADLTSAFRGDTGPADASTCRAIEAVAHRHSRHLELHVQPDAAVPDDPSATPGWPPPDRAEVRRRAAGVSGVRRDGGTCVLTLDALEPWGLARPYLDAAATLAAGAERLILDLRENGGGDPATVAGVAGWLLGDEARQLSEVRYRDHRRQWWTADRPAGSAFAGEVVVLVSGRTYSSAEALAYHLRVRERVTVVGETTRGAADHVVPVRLTPRVLGFLPHAEVRDAETGENWEGAGVVPDVRCPAPEALSRVIRAGSGTGGGSFAG